MTYVVALNDIRLVTGTKTGFAIPRGNRTGTLTSTLQHQRISEWWVSHVRNGETSELTVNTTVVAPIGPMAHAVAPPPIRHTVATDIIGGIETSLAEYEGSYPSDGPTRVIVKNTSAEWGQVTPARTPLLVTVTVRNPTLTPMPTPAFTGNLTMNGIEMARWQANEVTVRNAPADGTIGPRQTETITFVAPIANQNIDTWLPSHIIRGERTNLVLTASFVVTHQDKPYTYPAPYGLRCTAQIRTAIFVDNQTNAFSFTGCESGSPRYAHGPTNETRQSRSGTVRNDSATDQAGGGYTRTESDTQPPTARIAANKTRGEAPMTVSFDASDSTDPNADITDYVWRFDDGSSPQRGVSVAHTYRRAGTYTVKMTVIDSQNNKDTETVTVEATRRSP